MNSSVLTTNATPVQLKEQRLPKIFLHNHTTNTPIINYSLNIQSVHPVIQQVQL